MSDAIIRAAGDGDIAAITRIYAHAVKNGTATFEIEPPDEVEMARRQKALLAKNYPYVVAERSGVVAGYAYASHFHTRPTAGASRIRSMSIRNSTVRDWAGC
jgi:L-amino acid N-acyltransferase YncA